MFAWGRVVATLQSALGETDLMCGKSDVYTYVGARVPTHCVALGHAFILWCSGDSCHRLMDGSYLLGRCMVADDGNFPGRADPLLMGLSSIQDPEDRTFGTVRSCVIWATGIGLWLLLVALNAVNAFTSDVHPGVVGLNLTGDSLPGMLAAQQG